MSTGTTNTSPAVTPFEVGAVYECRSACDHECIWRFVVVARTEKRVTLVDERMNQFVRGIGQYRGVETCFPMGKYSMAPVLMAA